MGIEGPGFLFSAFVFIASFSVLVFIHEWGHYRVAKLFGVKIDSFAIGFGPELIGRTDKAGVRWKICALPLGGYVKFSGDANAASAPDTSVLSQVPESQREHYFHSKPLWQRALIVAAGPVINLIVPIFVFGGAAYFSGVYVAEPVIEFVAEDSAAERAGLEVGDRILAIDSAEISRFRDIRRQVELKPNLSVPFSIERGGERFNISVRLGAYEVEDRFGNKYPIGRLGIGRSASQRIDVGLFGALSEGVRQTGETITMIGEVARQLVLGLRSVKEVAGPIRIADMTGTVAEQGADKLILFLAMISINLGIVNLLPIPGLDGGHLLLYGLEAIKGSPLSEQLLEAGYRIGMGLLLIFMVFVFWNDLQSVAL